jgi:hydroxymethylglutaryl-CoA reductase
MSPTDSTIDVVFGSAPGKIILFGEHAVVFGQPAIASTIDRGIRVAVSRRAGATDGPVLRSTNAMLPVRCKPDPDGEGPERLRQALALLRELCGERVRELSFSVDGAIPAGAGLGSSAALAVALVRGIHQSFGETIDDAALIDRAFAVERVFHGNPSGVDHTTIVTGGVIAYERGVDGAPAKVSPLTLPRTVRLAIGVAGPHAGTANAVAALRDRARRHPEHYARLYDGIGALARAARGHLERGELGAVGELMDLNQGYLNALGVSTPAIEALCAIARERGALGAKLSGAGGGGAVIALVDDTQKDSADTIVRAFAAAGYAAFATDLPRSASQPHQETP